METEKLIRKTKTSHMSNAKWIKLFNACQEYPFTIGGVEWQFLGWDTFIKNSICVSDCLHNNERFNDCLPAPYAKLNEIEWILIPSQFEAPYSDKKRPLPNIFNDIEAIRVHLEKYANFPIIEVENGIKIIGYEY